MTETWPWLGPAGLGAFHGLNPGMGWLFAVALGLHRKSRLVLWLSFLPIAAGHALSVGVTATFFLLIGFLVDGRAPRIACGLTLIGWALYHWRYGHRHRVRFGMQAGFAGLAIWSFLMATAHGAGVMLWPALMPLCFAAGLQSGTAAPLAIALLAIGTHTLAMLVVIAALASIVYEWAGLAMLRRAWFNVDLVWTLALVVTGSLLLFGSGH